MAERRPDRVRGARDDQFWAFCEQGELRLQGCAACGKLSWPVTEACEHCGSDQLDWRPVSGKGRLVSWCAFHQDYYGGVIPVPYETILVELAEGPMFISNPQGFVAAETPMGAPVKLAFLACEDAAGAFRLPVFEKA